MSYGGILYKSVNNLFNFHVLFLVGVLCPRRLLGMSESAWLLCVNSALKFKNIMAKSIEDLKGKPCYSILIICGANE